ncbi:MAG: hypothetical protein IKB61_01965, partial [Elusimicrobiaceae bacterium]|nr:hypothetical protein [Elusimicrobiaceae bacterium]
MQGYICVSALQMRYFTGLDLMDGEAVFLITPRKAYCLTKEMILPKMQPVKDFISLKNVAGDMLAAALDLAVKNKLTQL